MVVRLSLKTSLVEVGDAASPKTLLVPKLWHIGASVLAYCVRVWYVRLYMRAQPRTRQLAELEEWSGGDLFDCGFCGVGI